MRAWVQREARRVRVVMGLAALSFAWIGACGPEDFERSSNRPVNQEPFGGAGRSGTGGTGGAASGGSSGTGAGTGCGDVTEVGMCSGFTITFCEDGMLTSGDCRTLNPSCRCGFNAEAGYNDCLCGGTGGTGGASGSGGVSGTGGGGAGTGGTSGTGGTAGTGGSSGTGGAGGMCSDGGDACMNHSECCTGYQCVSFSSAPPVCAANCNLNSSCASGCCVTLTDYTGACGPVASCGGTGCRGLGTSCDSALDCCATSSGAAARCVDAGFGGPRICSAPCTLGSDCASNCCHTDGSGVRACFPAEFCL